MPRQRAPRRKRKTGYKLVRIHPRSPSRGYMCARYFIPPYRFREEMGWYKVDLQMCEKLKSIRNNPNDPHSPPVFIIATPAEAKAMERADRVRQAKAAEPNELPPEITEAFDIEEEEEEFLEEDIDLSDDIEEEEWEDLASDSDEIPLDEIEDEVMDLGQPVNLDDLDDEDEDFDEEEEEEEDRSPDLTTSDLKKEPSRSQSPSRRSQSPRKSTSRSATKKTATTSKKPRTASKKPRASSSKSTSSRKGSSSKKKSTRKASTRKASTRKKRSME